MCAERIPISKQLREVIVLAVIPLCAVVSRAPRSQLSALFTTKPFLPFVGGEWLT